MESGPETVIVWPRAQTYLPASGGFAACLRPAGGDVLGTGMPFALHPNLASTSAFVVDLPLSRARLQLDARFPWLLLIPRREDLSEIDDLLIEERAALIEEIARASAAVRLLGAALNRPVEKINVGALGNVTPQLHVHVLGRRQDDGLWPDPVWGRGAAQPYGDATLARALDLVRRALAS